jgi:hypothetical protein
VLAWRLGIVESFPTHTTGIADVPEATVEHMDIAEFTRIGLLQEVNRQFFHPLGLALVVESEEDGTERLVGVWDNRGDIEGIVFADGVLSSEKADRVEQMWKTRQPHRERALGYMVQPLPEPPKEG